MHCSGIHIILPLHFCPGDAGFVSPNTQNGSVLFCLPWLGKTLVGTTEANEPLTSTPAASEDSIEYILNELRPMLSPEVVLRRDHVCICIVKLGCAYIFRCLAKRFPDGI